MYVIDSHIHMHVGLESDLDALRKQFLIDISKAGVSATQVMSPDPKRYSNMGFEDRINTVLKFCGNNENLYPFYWINPMEEGFLEQIDIACQRGIYGFKIICSGFYPGDENVIAACKKIAENNKPVLFHSGILWDGKESAKYNRPGEFEALIEIPNLRFCLAHVSWPWTDECIAVYGKFNNAHVRRPDVSCEMFIDVTPGSPHVYRDEIYKRLFGCEYQIKYNLMFGTDCNTEEYNIAWTRDWIETDVPLIKKYNPGDEQDTLEHIYSKNFLRFLGRSNERIEKIYPDVAH